MEEHGTREGMAAFALVQDCMRAAAQLGKGSRGGLPARHASAIDGLLLLRRADLQSDRR